MGKDMQEIEKTLWAAADKMIGGLSVSNYKFVVLGLIFLKYISDSFEEKYNELVAEGDGFEEDIDEYVADNIFFELLFEVHDIIWNIQIIGNSSGIIHCS